MSAREALALALAFSAAIVVQARELATPPPRADVEEFVSSAERFRRSLPDATARLAFLMQSPGSDEDSYRCQLAQYALAPNIVTCVGLGERPDASFLVVGGLPAPLATLVGTAAGFPRVDQQSGALTLMARE